MIKPIKPPTSPIHDRPPPEEPEPAVSNNVVQLHAGATPSFSPLPPQVETPPDSGSRTVSTPAPAPAPTPAAEQGATEPPNLSDSAKRRLELQKQLDADLKEAKERAKKRDSSTGQTMISPQASPKPAAAPAPAPVPPSQNAAERLVRDEAELMGASRTSEQSALRRSRRRWFAAILVALISTFIGVIVYSGRDSISASMEGLLASASSTAPNASASVATPSAKPTATAKPTTSTAPAAPMSSSCVPVTQAWVDAQPWAAGRSNNDINKFSTRNWPKSLNCGKEDRLMRWVDAKNVDISNCCQ